MQRPDSTSAVRAAASLLTLALVGCATGLLTGATAPGADEAAGAPPGRTLPAPGTTCMTTLGSPIATDGLAWIRMGQGRDLSTLDAWCASVGPAVFRPGPTWTGETQVAAAEDATASMIARAEVGPAPLDELVIVTWNVHVGGGDIEGLVRDLRSGALTGGRPVGAFVLLLQEAVRTGADVPATPARGTYPKAIRSALASGERLDVSAVAERTGLHVLYAPSMRNGGAETGAEDRGNAILSSLPLSSPAAIELPFEAQRRVAVAGTVAGVTAAGAPWQLRVVSAHLDNRSHWSRFLNTFGAGRTRQARALAEAVQEEAAVVGGDMNTWSAGFLEDALPLLRAQFGDSPPATGPTFTAGILPRTVDHLLFRVPAGWAARVERVESRYGSDHHPVLGVLRLGTDAGGSRA